MMRFNIVLGSLLLAATAATARPGGIGKAAPAPQAPMTLDLSNLHLHLFHRPDAPPATDPAAAPHREDWSQQPNLPDPFSMGPLHAQFGTDDNPWANLSNYESELGGTAWQDQQSRSRAAKLLFVWPTDK